MVREKDDDLSFCEFFQYFKKITNGGGKLYNTFRECTKNIKIFVVYLF